MDTEDSPAQVLPDLDLDHLSREELVEKVRKLTCHVRQLRNVVTKARAQGLEEPPSKKNKRDRPFDFSVHTRRHVALKVAYLGWDLQGLAAQEDTDQTVEAHIFAALERTRLIESRETSNYHRCGRTDKGVSAFSQVLSIDLRSKVKRGLGVKLPPCLDPSGVDMAEADAGEEEEELDYCKMLNRILPAEIRVLAWSPCRPGFSARFNCERTYKYYFPLADLDLDKMRRGAQFLIGTHDFRNLCKLDPNGENSTVRRVIEAKIELIPSVIPLENPLYTMCVLIIKGQSFVWHQIRCIVAVLILIGKGLEDPEIVERLLDISIQPKKPQYSMANYYPLVLFEVDHGKEVNWKYGKENIHFVLSDFQRIWAEHAIKSCMIHDMIKTLQLDESTSSGNEPRSPRDVPTQHLDSLQMGSKARIYQKLVDRPVCERTPIPKANSYYLDDSKANESS